MNESAITLPRMSPDEMEAKSRRHGNGTLLLVPLSSGKCAIFDRWGEELLFICDVEFSLPPGVDLKQIAAKSKSLHESNRPTQSPLSADELGL